jgi:hypothetical protein
MRRPGSNPGELRYGLPRWRRSCSGRTSSCKPEAGSDEAVRTRLTSRALCVAPPWPRPPLAAPRQRIREARDPDDGVAQQPRDGHITPVGGAPAFVFPARAPHGITFRHRSDSPLLGRLCQPGAWVAANEGRQAWSGKGDDSLVPRCHDRSSRPMRGARKASLCRAFLRGERPDSNRRAPRPQLKS